MKKIISLSLICFTLIFFNCSNVSEDDLIDVPPQQSGPDPVLITYDTNIKPIIDNNCIMCHSNPPINGAPIPLINFDNVKNAVLNSNLVNRISSQPGDPGAMPFGGPRLPQNLIDLITQWQTDGLLEN